MSTTIIFNKKMKKSYKNKLMQCMFALCVFGFTSCQEYDIDSQPEAPINIQIDALDNYTVLATAPSNIVFGVSANTPWSITSDQQWCKVTPTSSAISSLVSEVTVTAEPNDTPKERTATLTVTAEGVEATKVITVVQKSKENLVVIPFDEQVPTDGAKISFNIISNKAWEIIPSTQFLENIDKTKGEGDESGEKIKITIDVPANSGARRSGEITVKTAFEEHTFTINQDGVVIEMEEPTESGTIDFNGAAGEKTIKIRSNQEWKVKVPKEYQEWIVAEKTADGELKVVVTSSNRLVKRTGIIKLVTEKIIPGFEGVDFTVTQNPNFWFDANEGGIEVDEATGNMKITQQGRNVVNSNYAFKKGRIVFEFAGINLKANDGGLNFNFWPNAGNSNFHLDLFAGKKGNFTCGGGFAWEQATFDYSEEQIRAIRKIEFICEDDAEHAGMLRIKALIDGKEVANMGNKADVFTANPAQNPGENIYVKLYPGSTENYVTIKSITHYPAE